MSEQFEGDSLKGQEWGTKRDLGVANKLSTTLQTNIDRKNAEYVDLLGRIGVAYKKIPLDRLDSELNVLYFNTTENRLYELYTGWKKFYAQHRRADQLSSKKIEKLQGGDLILVNIDKHPGPHITAIDKEQTDPELKMGSSFRYNAEHSTEMLNEIVGDIHLPSRYKSNVPKRESHLQLRAERKLEEWLASLDDKSKSR